MIRNLIPMTPEGHRRLQEELKHLKAVERPKILLELETARAHGDLSENAEYHAAKEKQELIVKKIAEVENKIAQAQVIDPSKLNNKKVVFGAKVRLSDVDSGDEVSYQIVGGDESNIREGKISIESPIAKSLIGREIGDVVRVTTPRGSREFEVLEIRYE